MTGRNIEDPISIGIALALIEAMRLKCIDTTGICAIDMRSEGHNLIIEVSREADSQSVLAKYYTDGKSFKMETHGGYLGPFGKITSNTFYYLLSKALSNIGVTSESAALIVAKKFAVVRDTLLLP
jgi:hypothetical protein